MCWCKTGLLAALCSLVLAILLLASCSRHTALPPPTNAGREAVPQAGEESMQAGVYEEFIDSITLKTRIPVAAASGAGQQTTQSQPVTGVIMGYRVQLGAFNDQPSAESLAARVRQQTGNRHPVYVRYYAPMWKVHAGDCRTHQDAERLQSDFQRAGYPEAWIVNVGIQQ